MCLDGIASGTIFVDMEKLGVDLYITAPQKGWSSPACVGIVMLSKHAVERMENTKSSSFTLDLKKWISVSDAYENGGFMYHTTTPTDALLEFSKNIRETKDYGYLRCKDAAYNLGSKFREMLDSYGFKSVAADDWRSPTVIVSHCKENMVPKFKSKGIQVAGMVPFMLGEPKEILTFRIGLFGIDKLKNIEETLEIFRQALDEITSEK